MTRQIIYLFRHGETDWNREGRLQGHTDIPLNEKGRAQAVCLTEALRHAGVTEILSSDLSRAAETARIASQSLGLKISFDPRLREIRYGKLEGLTPKEMEQKYNRTWGDLYSRPFTDQEIVELGGEAKEDLLARVVGSIREHALQSQSACLGVSTHGGVIRRLIHAFDPEGRFPAPIPNCAMFPFEIIRPNASNPAQERWLPLLENPYRSC